MVWRPRVTVHDDLSRIHQENRRMSVARSLGLSSITKGEGSLDLTTSDGGTKAVVFGDQADGRFGISITHRGKLSFLPDIFVAVEDRVTATEKKNADQDKRLDGHDADVRRIDAKNTQQDNRLSSAESRLSAHDSTLSSHNKRINAAQARADKGVSDAAAAHSRADSAYSRASTGISNAATAQARADSAYSRASTGISNAATAQARADSAYSRAGTGISNAATAKSRADAAYSLAQGRATQSQINSLKSNFSKLASEIDSLAMRVLKIENQIRP